LRWGVRDFWEESSRGLNLSLNWGEERTGDIGEDGAVEGAAGESKLYTALVPAMEGEVDFRVKIR